MEGSGGTAGAPHPRQLPASAVAAAAVAAAARSATRAAATVLMVALEGCLWEAARWHRVQQDMPKCQRLQKVHPFMVGRGVRLIASRVFSPGNRRRLGIGRGLAIGSPSLPAPRPKPGVVPIVSGMVGGGWGGAVGGVVAGVSKD